MDPGRPGVPPERVWYAAYGSNTDPARLGYYIAGGRPPGAARNCPGCRDHRAPRESVPVELPGVLYFATESEVWSGGRAFYDPDVPGSVVRAHAHLITAGQFADIAAQEMYRSPGTDLDLRTVLHEGRARLGPGRYETLICPGLLDGLPVLTLTAPWQCADMAWNRPSGTYLRHLAAGLRSADAWDTGSVARYLAGAPGAAGVWTAEAVEALLSGAPGDDGPPGVGPG
ncbi:histone deacetylase [Streptomyces sp. NPDC000594]|uniref:histone deacetylase n=1 Tax=Streptomyces sp. NPDC000594 TaxID=3154261 RepID=UPI003325746E